MKKWLLFVLFNIPMITWAQGTSSTSVLQDHPAGRNYVELYSESTYYEKYNWVSESRLRYYLPFYKNDWFKAEAFFGAAWQWQAVSDSTFYSDAISPGLGVRLGVFGKVFLTLEERYRMQYSEPREQMSDPRATLSAGDLYYWNGGVKAEGLLTEGYGESSFVPRLSTAPVSVLWIKQAYRFPLGNGIYLDPYGEYFNRQSQTADLGPTITEIRGGLRALWQSSAWTVSGMVYRNFSSQERGSFEGLFVVGGVF
ncbi:hypothetical protein D3C87_410400 [compost metagenome]